MNIRDLKYLVAVADERHFGRAARLSHVSQPTLSMQLKKLEETLGVQLFERNNKQVMITQAGSEIAERARIILRDVDALYASAKAAQDPLAGEFRLGAFPTLAPYFLPPVIPKLRKQLPSMKFLLIEEKTDRLIERLKKGLLDAALLALPIQQEGLETRSLFTDPFLLAVPQGHRLAKRRQVTRRDIADEELLLLEEGHCLRAQALEVCSVIGASEHEDFRATSLETLRQMVAAGVGITLIPKLARREDDGIAYIPFGDPAPFRTIGLVWRKGTARRECIDVMAAILTGK
jgi:LysR family hydrogen peroxide-inducible transcriptional activator